MIIKDKERKSKVSGREMEKFIIRNDRIRVPSQVIAFVPFFVIKNNICLLSYGKKSLILTNVFDHCFNG